MLVKHRSVFSGFAPIRRRQFVTITKPIPQQPQPKLNLEKLETVETVLQETSEVINIVKSVNFKEKLNSKMSLSIMQPIRRNRFLQI